MVPRIHPMRRLSLAFLVAATFAAPLPAAGDLIVIDSLDALRTYAAKNHVQLRRNPGPSTPDRASSAHFLRFTGRGSHYDLHGVTLRIDTKLFRQFGVPR